MSDDRRATDPFSGRPRGGYPREHVEFPEDRLRQVGLEQDQLDELRGAFDAAPYEARQAFAASAAQTDNDTLRATSPQVLRDNYSVAGRTVEQVLADVDRDPELLATALVQEQGSSRPRKTLLAGLDERRLSAAPGERTTEPGDAAGDVEHETVQTSYLSAEGGTPAVNGATGEVVDDVDVALTPAGPPVGGDARDPGAQVPPEGAEA